MENQQLDKLAKQIQHWLMLAQKFPQNTTKEQEAAMLHLYKKLQQSAQQSGQQIVELLVPFAPAWVRLLTAANSTVYLVEKTGEATPFDITLSAQQLALELGATYKAVAYKRTENDPERQVISFVYDGSPEVLLEVKNQQSKDDETNSQQQTRQLKQAKALRAKITQILLKKSGVLSKTINKNTKHIVDDLRAFFDITAAYPSIDSDVDTQRKIFAATTSTFANEMVATGGKKAVSLFASFSSTLSSTAIGASNGGFYGAAAGFLVGVILDVVVNKTLEAYVLDATEATTHAKRQALFKKKLNEQISIIRTEAGERISEILEQAQDIIKEEFQTDDIAELKAILKRVKAFKTKTVVQKGQYLKVLLKNWTFTHAGNDSDDSGQGVDPSSWDNAVKKLKTLDGLKKKYKKNKDLDNVLECQVDVYLYQIRGIILASGLSNDYIQQLEQTHQKQEKHLRKLLQEGPDTPQETADYEQLTSKETNKNCTPYDLFYDFIKDNCHYKTTNSALNGADIQQVITFLSKSHTPTDSASSTLLQQVLNDYQQPGIQFTLSIYPSLVYDAHSIFLERLSWSIEDQRGEYRFVGIINTDNN